MDQFGNSPLLWILQALISGGGAWLAVRVELRYLRENVKYSYQHADNAHKRINSHIEKHAEARD